MVVKVKEPIAPEYPLMRKGQILFTYLHLAAAQELGHEMLKRGVDGVAYETIEPTPGDLPLLTPMSAVAGRMAVQAGATYLERERGGKGVLLGGVPGVRRGRVTIIGAGVVGRPSSVKVNRLEYRMRSLSVVEVSSAPAAPGASATAAASASSAHERGERHGRRAIPRG